MSPAAIWYLAATIVALVLWVAMAIMAYRLVMG
jgi:hypothetical protein